MRTSLVGRAANGTSRRLRLVRAPVVGFTVLELLVVMVILGVLAGLLIPSLRRGRLLAIGIVCQGHLRQWGMATLLYAADHEDRLPPEGSPNPSVRQTNSGWYVQLPAVLGLRPYHEMPWRTNASASIGSTVWLCPANARRSNGLNLFHYCLNQHVDGTSADETTVRLAELRQPSELVWLYDTKNLPAVGSWNFVHTNLHRSGAHLLFLDGHVAHFEMAAYRDPATGQVRTNYPGLRWVP